MKIVGILGVSHPLEKTRKQYGENIKRFTNQKCAQTCAGLGLSPATDGCWQRASAVGRRSTAEPTETEELSVYRQPTRPIKTEHLSLSKLQPNCRQLINRRPNKELANLTLSTTGLGQSTATSFSVSELFSDWDFEDVFESLLPRRLIGCLRQFYCRYGRSRFILKVYKIPRFEGFKKCSKERFLPRIENLQRIHCKLL